MYKWSGCKAIHAMNEVIIGSFLVSGWFNFESGYQGLEWIT